MTIIKEFHKDITEQEVKNWYFPLASQESAFQDIIAHFETKCDAMQKEIESLNKRLAISCVPIEASPKFKVGWIYRDSSETPSEYLILKITSYWILTHNIGCTDYHSFTLKGWWDRNHTEAHKDLVYSTGHRWEPAQ